MFFPEGQLRVYLYGQPADMRRSYDGLYALTRNAMGHDPMSGHLYALVKPARYADKGSVFRSQRILRLGEALGGWTVHLEVGGAGDARIGLHGVEVVARRGAGERLSQALRRRQPHDQAKRFKGAMNV